MRSPLSVTSSSSPRKPGEPKPDVRGLGLNLDRVLGVEREDVAHQNSAARAQRQSFDVIGLRQVARNAISDRGRRGARIAHGHPADLGGRGDVAFQQRGRDGQRIRDVVETFARIVGGKQRGWVDFQMPADRESSWRIRCDSGDAARWFLDLVWPRRRYPAPSPTWLQNHPEWHGPAAACRLGGIIPARTFRTTFSQVSALLPGCAKSSLSIARPPVESFRCGSRRNIDRAARGPAHGTQSSPARRNQSGM